MVKMKQNETKTETDQEYVNRLLRDVYNIYVNSRDNMPFIPDQECRDAYNDYMRLFEQLLKDHGVF